MRYIVSPEFASKVSALDSKSRAQLKVALQLIEAVASAAELRVSHRVHALEGGVEVLRHEMIRLYFRPVADKQGECLLLLDVAAQSPPRENQWLFPPKDPRRNPLLNPMQNPSLNPMVNGTINPMVNGTINPLVNGTINPLVNGTINPLVNGTINPMVNGRINPMINPMINPRTNPGFGGPYLYSKTLQPKGFVVRASDRVDLLFDQMGQWSGTRIQASDKVDVVFDKSGQWIGYFVRADASVALEFDRHGTWVGLSV